MNELAAHGVTAVAVSLDDDPQAAREWHDAAALSFPSVIDIDHRVAEWFGIVNVPVAAWFDESGQMVRPPTVAPGDDRFRKFSGVDSAIHHDALRAWAVDGVIDTGLMQRWAQPPSEDPGLARAHRRLAAYLHRHGNDDRARDHFAAAATLAPSDWTIRRGSMPLQGVDPFGAEFSNFAIEWAAAGRHSYTE
jgi:hypothetical protein